MQSTDAAAHASFTDFVRLRSDRLHDVAWLVTRNADDARDAVQDALAGLYRHWSRMPVGDEFEAYVHRTVVNACLGVIRRRPRSFPVAEPADLRTAPSEVSKYRVVGRAFPNAWFTIGTVQDPSQGILPLSVDYKTPKQSDLLAPGRYTYVLTRDEGGLGLRLEVDR